MVSWPPFLAILEVTNQHSYSAKLEKQIKNHQRIAEATEISEAGNSSAGDVPRMPCWLAVTRVLPATASPSLSNCGATHHGGFSPAHSWGSMSPPGLCHLCIPTLAGKSPVPCQHLLPSVLIWRGHSSLLILVPPPPSLCSVLAWCGDPARCWVAAPVLVGAAVTKHHRPAGLNNRYVFTHAAGGWKAMVKTQAIWFLVRALFPACRQRPSHCVFLRAYRKRETSVPFSSYKGTSPIALGPHPYGVTSSQSPP